MVKSMSRMTGLSDKLTAQPRAVRTDALHRQSSSREEEEGHLYVCLSSLLRAPSREAIHLLRKEGEESKRGQKFYANRTLLLERR